MYNNESDNLYSQKDKLNSLFKMQKEFQDRCGYWPDLKDVAAALQAEAGELWGESSGKWWKKHKPTREKQLGELADILHFFLIACLKIDVTPQELFDVYSKKLEINYQRHKDGY